MTIQAKAKDVRFTFERELGSFEIFNPDNKEVFVDDWGAVIPLNSSEITDRPKAIKDSIGNISQRVEILARQYQKNFEVIIKMINQAIPQMGSNNDPLVVGDIDKINKIMIGHFVGR